MLQMHNETKSQISHVNLRQTLDSLNQRTDSSLDMMIAPNFRLWMLLALILSILLFMTVVVCCFIKLRIPRTKREIELNDVKRKLTRKGSKYHGEEDIQQSALCSRSHTSSDQSEENIIDSSKTPKR
ncbi:hypothetical protein T02_5076 [Trichinella nativa]|uniref:Uncharacterized protein n=5 Tax=Trichinella TaxID=6333 RepID=A0A0V1L5H6_9BILA|nr:hypothetical protein T06_4017 [Trichinella sp. T6]KRX58163.1 hypothetical protein T09_5444 [Trichinella sp. T9]KRY14750.1 hypothetical protein T12_12209 [Trichinella patagoniensis]KRY47528.1 hypothetical protein T03_10146 [Trichinella britovi]KRZ54793.1 hypothetical protein T02_5076 [Trichinella nativa]KRZ87425.1 hypothetical protein T08_15878 [Trichinella sp. T8]